MLIRKIYKIFMESMERATTSRGGGIGIRAALRWLWEQSCAGSSPVRDIWACGEIGIHVRFRFVCRKAWKFESSHAHLVNYN